MYISVCPPCAPPSPRGWCIIILEFGQAVSFTFKRPQDRKYQVLWSTLVREDTQCKLIDRLLIYHWSQHLAGKLPLLSHNEGKVYMNKKNKITESHDNLSHNKLITSELDYRFKKNLKITDYMEAMGSAISDEWELNTVSYDWATRILSRYIAITEQLLEQPRNFHATIRFYKDTLMED